MDKESPSSSEQLTCFVNLLKNKLPEHRDNRGKRHTLVLVIVGFVTATLVGRQKLSGVHRYMCNRSDWLSKITQTTPIKPISRAHSPRLLNGLNWAALNELIERCFGIRIEYCQSKKWIAIDGKALRGTLDAGEKQNVSLDAHHFNPITTSQIHQGGGHYLTQVKENQAMFLKQCKDAHAQFQARAKTSSVEKAHGRVTTRHAYLFSLSSLTLDLRWKDSGLSALIVVERETFESAKQKTSYETSYYVSNAELEPDTLKPQAEELIQAIRRHWGVESNNWIRDVTFNEDRVKTKAGNQSQIMALLRGLAIELIRKTSPKNFQAAIENFSDSASTLESMLKQVKFL